VNHENYSPDVIRNILQTVKTIALVGASANEVRPSYFVMKYLIDKGYDVIPVNPGLAGQQILGQTVYASLGDIPKPVDMVDIFRNSDAAGPITDEALALSPKPRVIWMQLSVRNDRGPSGGHEPLPQDGVWQALRRMGLGGRRFRHHFLPQAIAARERQGAEPRSWAPQGLLISIKADEHFRRETRPKSI
jgi:predicted CoA-binding protein